MQTIFVELLVNLGAVILAGRKTVRKHNMHRSVGSTRNEAISALVSIEVLGVPFFEDQSTTVAPPSEAWRVPVMGRARNSYSPKFLNPDQ